MASAGFEWGGTPPLPNFAGNSASGFGGTRHQSAARFVAAHHDAVAVVASHDGPLSVIIWVKDRDRLLVIRDVDVLLD